MAVIAKNPIIGADCTLTIKSAAGAVVLQVPYTNGDFKISGLNAANAGAKLSMQEVTDYFARGTYFASRYTKGKILEFSFTGHLTALVGAVADPAASDPVLKKIDWSAVTSTLAASAGDVPHFSVEWAVERSNLSATADNLLVLKYCELSVDWAEGDEGSTFTINGKLKPYSTDSFTAN